MCPKDISIFVFGLKYNPTEIIIFGDDIDFDLIKNKLNFDTL